MITPQLETRSFHVINHKGPVEAIAQFIYKGYQVSFTTMYLFDDIQHPVAIFALGNKSQDYDNPIYDTSTVEEAIQHIDSITT